MNPLNFNSIVEFIRDLFSELPLPVLVWTFSAGFFALIVFAGGAIAFIVGFFALFLTQNGPLIIIICALIFSAFLIYGLVIGYQTYKKMMLSHKHSHD